MRRSTRRMELLDAADNVIRRDGPAASMDVLAAEAGITKPILYRHFGDKGGLYTALADRYTHALMNEIKDSLAREAGPRSRLRLTIDTYLSFLESEPQVYRFLVHRAQAERPEVHEAIGAFVRGVAGEVAAAARDEMGLGSSATFAEPLAFAVVGAVQATGEWWLEHPEVERRELADQLVTLIWDGFESYAKRGSDRLDDRGHYPTPPQAVAARADRPKGRGA